MQKKAVLTSYRMFFALLGLSAIVTEIATLIERGKFVPFNFFSFFTIESNLIAIAVLIISAVVLAHSAQNRSVTMLRGVSTFNMIVVGVVFSLLLSRLDADLTAVPWDNTVLHYIMPIVVALDWLIDRPKIRMTFKQGSVWMIFPIIYVIYSLIRGAFVNWYPYPFLNPDTHGYLGVALTSIGIAIGGLGLVWILVQFSPRASKTRKK